LSYLTYKTIYAVKPWASAAVPNGPRYLVPENGVALRLLVPRFAGPSAILAM
jgi:hypothetical protein